MWSLNIESSVCSLLKYSWFDLWTRICVKKALLPMFYMRLQSTCLYYAAQVILGQAAIKFHSPVFF